MKLSSKVGSVLVVGGGVAGIQASLDLAELGYKVYLIENNPSIGGVMGQLDKTFPTLDCSMCILAPKMVEAARNPNIELITYSKVEKIEGEAGNFEVTVLKKARYVDPDKCKSCGICHTHCPIAVKDEYNMGLGVRTAIYIPFPQAVPSTYVVDKETCLYLQDGICQICEKVCEVGAVDHNQKDEQVKISVGAIILAVGTDTFDPSILPQYGYGKIKNVVTSIEFERILNASGPYKGHLVRPLNMKHPNKILWLNCIGSRNIKIDKGYCSAVCCMYTIKQALIAIEHAPDLKCHICFIDMRTVGKGFEEFYVRAQNSGIEFSRGRVSLIKEDPHTGDLIVTMENTETGEMIEETYDIIVLSIGLAPSEESVKLAETFDINLNNYNFCSTELTTPLATSKAGIYVCGTFSGPKDIPETVAEASGAAGRASTLLTDVRNTLITKKDFPPEISIEEQEPRIGTFICHCGINIGGIVNVPEVVKFVKTLPNVVYTEENLYTCSADTQNIIKEKIKEHNLNRVVVASCTPRTHEPLFQNTLREAGLNQYLFEFVNIREQCSWVHMNEPESATEKAKELVAMGIAKAKFLKPIHESVVDIKHSGLIIGGGISGMTAALELANQGYETNLIEKEKDLGGIVKGIHYLIDGTDPQKFLNNLINQVRNHDKIKTFTDATIEDIQGFIGSFTTFISQNGSKSELDSGVIIVATGGKEYTPIEYEYGKDERILTQHELEQKIIDDKVKPNTVIMIQCVGSRNDERPYCSKICCSIALKNALKLKEKNSNTNVIILYRDLRAYGFKEDYYKKAREKGVMFIRFEKESEPIVEIKSTKLKVTVEHSLLKTKIAFKPDLIVLSSAFLPTENKELSQFLKVPLESNGFFLEAHIKLRPLDFATDGIFLCGTAQWPKLINESLAQAKGAAARACTILAKDKIKVGGSIASINTDLCSGCESCIQLCPFKAIRKNEMEEVEVIGVVCKGCGVCAASCPKNAITVLHFTNDQILSEIDAIIGGS
ncbi:MAG: CoB--CoM heterodisulfide reductase iron-sulfur subunit A family protein [Candidatus Helarchaeota archaeon]|nr:CoB--CoM heterodisulfide reductase iron-sulfur subunit A family protein [Candidatus Helarchaeota archaeon]